MLRSTGCLAATNAYESNLQNLKIQTPIDDNFSDDELTFMPCDTPQRLSIETTTPESQLIICLLRTGIILC